MATTMIRDTGVYINGWDFSGDMNEASVTLDVELHDQTTFRTNGTRAMRGGLIKNQLDMKGFVNYTEKNTSGSDSEDADMFSFIGLNTPVGSICPEGVDIGDPAFLAEWVFANYNPGATVGDLLGFTIKAEGRSRLTKGYVLNPALTAVTGAGSAATKVLVGAVPAGKQAVAHLHVVAINGGTLTVTVRSDANGTAGGETNRIAFTGKTAVGYQRSTLAAPITDTYWDVSWTYAGTSALFLVTFGIESLSL